MSTLRKIAGITGGLTLVLFALGADDALQTIDAKGMTFKVPMAWKSSKPTSQMRRAQLSIEPVKGDSDPAELVIFGFPTGAGTIEANVERWRNQFKNESGKTPEAKSTKVKGKNVEVTRVEVSGEYRDPFAKNQSAKPNYRLLGAIAESKTGTAFFLKLVGPDKTVDSIKKQFDKALETIEVD
jgi:hypothetical protein